jgi:hypothetical protein
MLEFVPNAMRAPVLAFMEDALAAWLDYRDEVARECGLQQGRDGKPVRLAS